MSSHFYSMITRMKYIKRWGLMRNTKEETLYEHSLEVAFIAHALALIKNRRLGGAVVADRAAVVAMFHDTTEILTGDLPTPIKYYSPEISSVYKGIEAVAEKQLQELLPQDLREDFAEIYSCPEPEILAIVKAADKISALIKCIDELSLGNREFSAAENATRKAIKDMKLKEADIFLEEFLPSFSLPIDNMTIKK